jgi:hypothetical protein
MIVSASENKFEQPEPGVYVARCYRLIDLGTQKNEYKGEVNFQRQIIIGWEIGEKMSDGQPFVVGGFYTLSLSEKANLRKMLQSWRGRDFTEAELKGFDLRTILDKPCTLNLTKTDKDKIKVASVSPLMKGVTPLQAVNATQYFSFDEFTEESFNAVSDKLREKIKLSPEYAKAIGQVPDGHETDTSGHYEADLHDDIPF